MQYNKRPIDYLAQVNILKQRGLFIPEVEDAICWLQRISYFRLAEYWHPMEANKQTHKFMSGSVFTDAVKLYSFDKELRTLLFSALKALLPAFPNVNTTAMGFPAGWRDEALWK